MDHFVVRLWTPAAPTAETAETVTGLHGTISHVATGRSETFRDGSELLRRLIDLRGQVPDETRREPTAGR